MKKILISSILSLTLGLTACQDFLDINKDPNYPAEANAELLFSSAVIGLASELGGEMQLTGAILSQQYMQGATSNQYNPIYQYVLDGAFRNGFWSNPYARSLTDLYTSIDYANKAGQDNMLLMNKVMVAFNFHILSDWYGDIPFTEALKGSAAIYAPKYDDSKTVVYPGMIALLDEAIALETKAKANPSVGKADFVYSGNIDQWVAFAKTLKLKLLMRDFAANQTAIQALINAGGLLVVDAGVIGKFTDEVNKSNPLFEQDRRSLNVHGNLRGCAPVTGYMVKFNDPRLAAAYEPGATGRFGGLQFGVKEEKDSYGGASARGRLAPTDGVYFLSEVESYFLQAEVWARLGNSGNAKVAYDKAVQASFMRSKALYNVYSSFEASNDKLKKEISDYVASFTPAQLDGSEYVAVGGAYAFNSAASLDGQLTQILTQKWIASIRFQSWDAFFDINRTGIPALGTVAVGAAGYVWGTLTPNLSGDGTLAAGQFPKRLMYPQVSTLNNVNAPNPLPAITAKLWWQK